MIDKRAQALIFHEDVHHPLNPCPRFSAFAEGAGGGIQV